MPRYTSFKDPAGESPALLPRIGKIGLGVKQKNKAGKEYPCEVDYFVLDDPSCKPIIDAYHTTGIRFYNPATHAVELYKIDDKTAQAWASGKGGPKSLPVMFSSPSMEDIAPKSLEWWGKGIKFCCGNGVQATRLQWGPKEEEPRTGEPKERQAAWTQAGFKEIPCPCEHFETGECKRCMRLFFMIPDVSPRGCFQIDTTSRASINGIESSLPHIQMWWGRTDKLLDVTREYMPILVLYREPWKSTVDNRVHYAVKVTFISLSISEIFKVKEGVRRLCAGDGPAPARRMLENLAPPDVEAATEQPRAHGNDTYLGGKRAEAVNFQAGEVTDAEVVDIDDNGFMQAGEPQDDTPFAEPTQDAPAPRDGPVLW